jgi:hypothetical protein
MLLMIAPDICIPAIHAMKGKYGDKIWARYGFADAFNEAAARIQQSASQAPL